MSPEQARGKPADRRSDIWAFGCVLYELLAGKRAFGGETSSDSLARILERDPEWQRLPDATPIAVRRLIRRCLAKDPNRRLHDMADVRLELEEAPELEALARPATEPAPLWRRALPWVVAAVGVGVAIWHLIQPSEVAPPESVSRFSLPSPPLALGGNPDSPLVAISPDGSMLAYVVGEGDSGQLYLRRLDSTEPVALEGAERVAAPFFSPDGAWVGFQVDREIRRIPVEGGKSWTICEVGWPFGATWGPDGTIVYGDELTFGLWRVPWNGGQPERLTTVDRKDGEYAHISPQFLPGGEAVLFTVIEDSGLGREVALVDLETRETTTLFDQRGGLARYLASGHLAYGLDGSLMVVPFDLKSRKVTGRPVAVVDGLLMGFPLASYLVHFAVADNGTLIYVSGPFIAASSRLLRVDRAGNAEPIGQVEEQFFGPRFSPERLTRNELSEQPTTWTPDGRTLIFQRNDHPDSAWDVMALEP